eukprot:TRINITY_DN8428_c0_g1_i2.p1 TRINITY_DN8428_c0_g1~~TRINITY_DN8428_c0_g1_i2.p1  ORF type:complete len:339 (-),score=68.27 TRINITY_DN8428_c0_g1_i2:15-1031(-)
MGLKKDAPAQAERELLPDTGGKSSSGKGKKNFAVNDHRDSTESGARGKDGASGKGKKSNACGKAELRQGAKGSAGKFADNQESGRPSGALTGSQIGANFRWLKEMKECPGREGKEFCASWHAWCTRNNVKAMEKDQWMQAIDTFRKEYKPGESGVSHIPEATNRKAHGGATATQVGAGVRTQQPSSAWVSGIAAAAKSLLDEARDAGKLPTSMAASTSSSLRELASAGKRALREPLEQRTAKVVGGLFDGDGLSELRAWCVSSACLAAAGRALGLPTSSDRAGEDVNADDDVHCAASAEAFAAVCGELSESNTPEAKRVFRSMVDFLALLGMGMLAIA